MQSIKEWFSGIGDTISDLGTTISNNVGSLILFLALMCAIAAIASWAESIICKQNGIKKNEKFRLHRITLVAVMSAVAIILNLLRIPVVLFYKLDFGDLPAIIGGFAMGPVAGVMIEFIKIILNLLLNGTDSAFVGEAANVIFGCAFVLPASIIYFRNKTKKSAIKGLVFGTLIAVVIGAVLNGVLMIPTYARIYMHSDSIDAIINMGHDKVNAVNGIWSFLAIIVVPFNLLKFGIVSIITMFIYKPISHLIKKS